MIWSRPEGLAQLASILKAMVRADEDTSDRLAASASAAARSAPPSRKLALRTRRERGRGVFAVIGTTARAGIAVVIGTSLIARAASSTSRGSGSFTNSAISRPRPVSKRAGFPFAPRPTDRGRPTPA